MKEIPMLERFAAQSLVEHEGELIFSKEKFAELIVRECEKVSLKSSHRDDDMGAIIARQIKQYFGVEE